MVITKFQDLPIIKHELRKALIMAGITKATIGGLAGGVAGTAWSHYDDMAQVKQRMHAGDLSAQLKPFDSHFYSKEAISLGSIGAALVGLRASGLRYPVINGMRNSDILENLIEFFRYLNNLKPKEILELKRPIGILYPLSPMRDGKEQTYSFMLISKEEILKLDNSRLHNNIIISSIPEMLDILLNTAKEIIKGPNSHSYVSEQTNQVKTISILEKKSNLARSIFELLDNNALLSCLTRSREEPLNVEKYKQELTQLMQEARNRD